MLADLGIAFHLPQSGPRVPNFAVTHNKPAPFDVIA